MNILNLERMCSNNLWYVTLTCFLLQIPTIVHGQSSDILTPAETELIVSYGNKIFESIKNYKGQGNIIDEWRRIGDELKIQELMSHIPPSILHRYSCGQDTGLYHVESMLQFIDRWYDNFKQYFMNGNNDLRNEFIANMTIMHDLGLLNDKILFGSSWNILNDPYTYHELFQFLVDLYDPMATTNCGSVQSLNQYTYDLLNRILYEYIKIYSIIVYSYTDLLLSMNNHATNIDASQKDQVIQYLTKGLHQAMDDYETNSNILIDNAFRAIERSSRVILSRDPSVHVKGVTYESLDYFIQGYVTSQEQLTDDGICRPSCALYKNVSHHHHHVSEKHSLKAICTGRIRDCRESVVGKICLAPRDSTRRYDGLARIPTKGRSLQYWDRVSETCTIHNSIPAWFSDRMCRICSCTCDMIDSPKSTRYIDLKPQQSRWNDSFVLTGIRFRIINRILYLQIQEGKLMNGKIIEKSVIWKDIEEINRDHNEDNDLFKFDYDHRLIDLADLTLPSPHVVTMVKFEVMNGIIGLRIEGRPIVDGKLCVVTSNKLSNESIRTLSSKPIFRADVMDIPTRGIIENTQITEPNKFLLKFETSDWSRDAGQNVVPFVDLRNVYTDFPSPVAGIGVYIRYGGTSAGFLALKLISIDNGMKFSTTQADGTTIVRRPSKLLRFG